jgi:large subunit ribosomal protein L7/L12
MAFDKDAFLSAMDSMSVMELNDLVKAIEEKFGVSAAVAAAPGGGGGGGAAAAPVEEKTEFNWKPARTRCRSSRPCAKSPAWA